MEMRAASWSIGSAPAYESLTVDDAKTIKSRPSPALTFMFVTSFGQSGLNSSGVIPAADIALEDINNSENVLPGYNLVYDQVRDSQVSIMHGRFV